MEIKWGAVGCRKDIYLDSEEDVKLLVNLYRCLTTSDVYINTSTEKAPRLMLICAWVHLLRMLSGESKNQLGGHYKNSEKGFGERGRAILRDV